MTSLSKPIKRRQFVDRLSELPDSLLVRILSFLKLKQTVITAVLSKRWQFLWTQSPCFVFKDCSSTTEKIREFVSSVHRTLVSCGRNCSETFEVVFSYGKGFSSDVDAWVDFAVKNKVKRFCLILNSSYSHDRYTLPGRMFHNSYMKHLSLKRCILSPQRTIEWRSLTELTICCVELKQCVIEKILSGCPVLYCLHLLYCWGFNRLEVDSRSLHELVVYHCTFHELLLQISAPYLHVLGISLSPKGIKLRLDNVSSLVRAIIGFGKANWDNNSVSVDVMNNAKEILEKTQHAKVLVMAGPYVEAISWLAVNGYQFPQSTRAYLAMVKASTEKLTLHGIVRLLESSPKLEALVVEGRDFHVEPSSFPDPKSVLDRDLVHLKTITIKDFINPNLGWEPLLTLAPILLKKATTLKKMVVDIEGISTCALSERLNIAQMLLSCPRSSKEAVVIFK